MTTLSDLGILRFSSLYLTKPAIIIAGVDIILLKFGILFAVRRCIVGIKFC